MITLNSYVITERAVFSGVSLGVSQLLKDVNNFKDPNLVVDTISQVVMSELCDVLDFGQSPVRFTTDLMRKMWQVAQEQQTNPSPTPTTDNAE
jgi:hypothetical protein